MRKRILLLSSVLLTLSLITVVIFNNVDNKENNIISNINKDKQVINSNMITMMYETESGSGKYIETKDISWPESGYIFNDTLSGCENGGELEYNSENNTVNLLSNSSDQCYVYFDKYDGVWIDNVVATNVTGSSITLDVSATSENGNITTYYYSLNDSEEYIETTTNPIIIDDLNKLTEYNIKIYAIDNTNARSNIYELNITTTDISVPVINSVEVSDITTSGFTLTVNVISDVEIKRYYYIIESENISGTSITNNYTFTNLKDNTNYNVLIFVENNNGLYSEKYEINTKTEEGKILLADWVKGEYNGIQGNNGIYYHTSSLANSAEDNSYRYAGANPNNYVCFGSDASICPSDNLYRIIGVFGEQVKLIKWDYATENAIGEISYSSNNASNYTRYKGNLSIIYFYQWNDIQNHNVWSEVKINSLLNNGFLNSFNLTWQNKIATYMWYVGGTSSSSGVDKNAKYYYNFESSGTTWSGKIGLMYVSDYGYAASLDYWTNGLYSYSSARDSNWMYMGVDDMSITRTSSASDIFMCITGAMGPDGTVGSCTIRGDFAVRPCFYLNSDVTYISGTGTQSDPFRIK